VVDVLDIVQSDVSALGDRLAARNSPSHILQVLEGSRQLGVHEVGIERAVRHVRERRHRQLLVIGRVRHNAESAGLCQASRGTGVGAEAEPEALEVEGLDAGAGAGDRLGVGVECQLCELEEVEGTCGAGLLGFGVWNYGGEAFDWTLKRVVSEVLWWVGIVLGVGAYEDDDAAPAEAVVEADGEELGDCDGGGEVIELVEGCQWTVSGKVLIDVRSIVRCCRSAGRRASQSRRAERERRHRRPG
jgi:hypothetical protein